MSDIQPRQRVHLYIDDQTLRIDLEILDSQGCVEECDNLDCHPIQHAADALENAWRKARRFGFPLFIAAAVLNLPKGIE